MSFGNAFSVSQKSTYEKTKIPGINFEKSIYIAKLRTLKAPVVKSLIVLLQAVTQSAKLAQDDFYGKIQ